MGGSHRRLCRGFPWPWYAAGVLVIVLPLSAAQAVTFAVDSTTDAPDAMVGDGVCATADGACTLRAAVQEADVGAGADQIDIPAGTYLLTLTGANENQAATGDLDITADLTVVGAGAGSTIINGNGSDRVLDVFAPAIAMISGVTIQSGNPGNAEGGGIRNAATLTLTDVVIRDNTAGIDGGGIVNIGQGVLQVASSTFSGNSAAFGGGFANVNTASAQLTNVTISSNSASFGGAIYNDDTGTIDLLNVTISNNAAAVVAGGIESFSTIQITNTIVANSTGGNCAGRVVVSLGHNLDSGVTCVLDAKGDLSSANPHLGALQDNGGSTPTRALLAGSAAIDVGDDIACPPTDQRGALRPADGNGDGIAVCDIGAYEVQPPSTPGTPTHTVTRTPTATMTPGTPPSATSSPPPTPTRTPESTDCCQCQSNAPLCGPPVGGTCGACVLVTGARCDGVTGMCVALPPSATPTATPPPTPTRTPGANDCCECAGTPGVCGPPSGGTCGDCVLVFDAVCDGGTAHCVAFTATPTNSPTATPTATATNVPTDTPTATAIPSDTSTPLPTATATVTPTATSTASPTVTPTVSPTASPSATPTTTPSVTQTVTVMPTVVATLTGTPASATETAAATATRTVNPTAPETETATVPAMTATAGETTTPTEVPVETPSEAPTSVVTATPTAEITATETPQETATPAATAVPCAGDCSGDGQVTVDEVIVAVNIALGEADLSACVAADANRDGRVTVDEIVLGVGAALNGCPDAGSTAGIARAGKGE